MNTSGAGRGRRNRWIAVVVVLAAAGWPATAAGQSAWTDVYEPSLVGVEVLRPDLRPQGQYPSGRGTPSALSTAWFLTGRYAVSDVVRLVAEVPVSHRAWHSPVPFERQAAHTVVGNPYLGVEIHHSVWPRDQRVFVEAGVRLPTMPAPDAPDHQGALTGFYGALDRQEAFLGQTLSLRAVVHYTRWIDRNFSARFRFGPVARIFSGHLEQYEPVPPNELDFVYGAQAWFHTRRVVGAFGIDGRFYATDEDASASERVIHEAALHLRARTGRYTPGLYVRVPLDDEFGRLVTAVYGLTFTAALP